MKKLTTTSIIYLFLMVTFSFAQNESGLEIEIMSGIQKNDKRFWGPPSYQDRQRDWGTYQFGFRLNKYWRKDHPLYFKTGIGLAQEIRTYRQPFDHCFPTPGGACTRVLLTLDSYQIFMLQTPIQVKYEFLEGYSLGFMVLPLFDYYKSVKTFNRAISHFKLGLYSIEFSPTFDIHIRRWTVGVGYRLYELKRVDRVYLYGGNFTRENPNYLDQIFDSHNPTKWFLTVGFQL